MRDQRRGTGGPGGGEGEWAQNYITVPALELVATRLVVGPSMCSMRSREKA